MNSLEKRSFYSFLSLYIISSTLFIFISGYWYYTAQKSSLQSNDYYKLQHIADRFSQEIISSHMQGKSLPSNPLYKMVFISLIDTKGKLVGGDIKGGFSPQKDGYFQANGFSTLVSSAPQEHQNIKFVLVQSSSLSLEITALKLVVIAVMLALVIVMMVLAWVLSKLFMKPLHQKILQIEDFVHDTAHELNTPITALSMSVSRALKKESYDQKILKNISISTKQLFDIYTALSYLSFESRNHDDKALDLSQNLAKSIEYYRELCESKKVQIHLVSEAFEFMIDEAKLSMLFGNLINNAIKYSHPNSTIEICLKEGIFSIQDNGIGIEEEKLSKIYEKYNRETDYAGGFGIGLSIVQKIAQEYDIGLAVNSQKDKGTCFTLDFSKK